MDRGAWWTMVHGCKESDTTERLSTYNIFPHMWVSCASLVAQTVKKQPGKRETQVWSLGQEDALEKGRATPAVFLSGESHGQRTLEGNSPRSHRESEMTEQLTQQEYTCLIHTHTHTHTPKCTHIHIKPNNVNVKMLTNLSVQFSCLVVSNSLWF